jgi:hypothetical protein
MASGQPPARLRQNPTDKIVNGSPMIADATLHLHTQRGVS